MRVTILIDADGFSSGYLVPMKMALRNEGVDVMGLSFTFNPGSQAKSRSHPAGHVSIAMAQAQSGEFSPDVVRKVASFQKDSRYRTVETVAIKMLDRHDYYGVLRNLDRQVLLKNALLQIFQYLLRNEPGILVFLNSPHLFGDYLTYEAARQLGIRTLHFQPTPLCPAMLVRSAIGVSAEPVQPVASNPEVEIEILEKFEERLSRLLEWEPPPYIKGQVAGGKRAMTLLGRLRGWFYSVRWLFVPRFDDSPDMLLEGLLPQRLVNPFKFFLSVSLERSLRREIENIQTSGLSSNRFALFALHYEPERTVTPEGLPFVHQEDAILFARSLLPDDVTLVVKEHYSQSSSSLRGFLGRSPVFYRSFKNLPNTVLAGTKKWDQSQLQKAEVVFTMTGTIGIEAANLGIPVGYFGSPWWEGLPGTLQVREQTRFDDLIELRSLGIGLGDSFFRNLIRSSMIPGIASEEPESYQRRNSQLSPRFFQAVCEALSAQILSNLVLGKKIGP